MQSFGSTRDIFWLLLFIKKQSDQSWSTTDHDYSDIVITRCLLECYKQFVNTIACVQVRFVLVWAVQTFGSTREIFWLLHRDNTMWWFVLTWAVQSFGSTRDIFWLLHRDNTMWWFVLILRCAVLWLKSRHFLVTSSWPHYVVVCLDLSCAGGGVAHG